MEEKMSVKKALELVEDEQSFLVFLQLLGEDFADERAKDAVNPSEPYGQGANGWEHSTIDAFLDAAATWGKDSKNGSEYYAVPSNPWKRCADIIHMGKIYE